MRVYTGSMDSNVPAAPDAQPSPPTAHTLYQVRLAGNLDASWQVWFDDMQLHYDSQRDETLLTGAFVDQSALHGLLAKIRDLDLQLVELRRMDA